MSKKQLLKRLSRNGHEEECNDFLESLDIDEIIDSLIAADQAAKLAKMNEQLWHSQRYVNVRASLWVQTSRKCLLIPTIFVLWHGFTFVKCVLGIRQAKVSAYTHGFVKSRVQNGVSAWSIPISRLKSHLGIVFASKLGMKARKVVYIPIHKQKNKTEDEYKSSVLLIIIQ